MRALVVEDDRRTADFVSRALSDAGFSVDPLRRVEREPRDGGSRGLDH